MPEKYDKSHFTALSATAKECGWSNAKLLDRLNDLGVETQTIRDNNDELVPVRLTGYTDVIHNKILDELDKPLADKLLADVKGEQLHGAVTSAHLENLYESAKDCGLDDVWVETKLKEFGASITGRTITKQRIVSFDQLEAVQKIVDEIRARGEAVNPTKTSKPKAEKQPVKAAEKIEPVDTKAADETDRLVATYRAIVANCELHGISSEEVDGLLVEVSADRSLSDQILGQLSIKVNEYAEMMGIELGSSAQGVGSIEVKTPAKLVETFKDMGKQLADLSEKIQEVEAKKQESLPIQSAESVAAGVPSGALDAVEKPTKGRKKTEKQPKEQAPRAEGDPVFTSDNDPANFIAHSVRLGKLKENLVSLAAEYEAALGLKIRFEPYPFGLEVFYLGDGEPPEEKLTEIATEQSEIFADEIRRCYIHAVDYLGLRRKTQAEIAALDEDYRRVRKDLEEKLSGCEFVYHASFFDWALKQLKRKPDGSFKTKTIKTLGGCVSIKKSGGVKLTDRDALEKHFQHLLMLADSNYQGDAAEAEKQEAKAIIDACCVSLEQVTEERLKYEWGEIIKPLAEAGMVLPGVLYEPVNEVGRLEYDQ